MYKHLGLEVCRVVLAFCKWCQRNAARLLPASPSSCSWAIVSPAQVVCVVSMSSLPPLELHGNSGAAIQ